MGAPQQLHAGSTAAAYGSNTAVVGSTAAALPRRAMQWWATGRPTPNASGGPPRGCPADIRWPANYIFFRLWITSGPSVANSTF